MTQAVVLALDQATTTGWAIGKPDGSVPKWGRFTLPGGRDETPAFCQLYDRIVQFIDGYGVTQVFFEAPIRVGHEAVSQDFRTYGFVTTIMIAAAHRSVPSAQVRIGDWRKRFLGTDKVPVGVTLKEARRNWFKREAIKQCANRGWLVDDDNVAEALGIMHYALCCVSHDYEARSAPLFRRLEGFKPREI